MTHWYALNLGDGIMAALPSAEIEARFRSAFTTSGSPPEMAVFTRPESEGHLHCEVIAYFSPAAAEVARAFDARAFDARACAKPARAGLGLLAGAERAWSLLFPDENQ